MNENNHNILDQIPLADVMAGWGHTMRRQNAKGDVAYYLCPWHDDHHPSLQVERKVREGATAPMFKCYRCGPAGYGAIQLAARLMGYPAGKIPDDELPKVMAELATRCDVNLEEETDEEGRKWQRNLRMDRVGWSEFRKTELQYADWTGDEPLLERGDWTVEGLRALGLKVEMSTHKGTFPLPLPVMEGSDMTDGDGATAVNVSAGGEIGASQAAVIDTTPLHYREGQGVGLLTDFDPDTGEPLYRCSLGAGFYGTPKDAEKKTVEKWGELVERLFHVQPVARVITRKENQEKGGFYVQFVKATRNYPIFMFCYPFGTKKYEPKNIYGYKWAWKDVDESVDVGRQWYADADLEDFLKDGVIPEQDKRHPYVEIEDKEKKTKQIRFGRIVLCSGPRDAMAVYSHSNAHVVWLNSEQAGFDGKGGTMRPNRWLRALLRKLQNVCVEGGLYVCYDEDETGLKASQAIALSNPTVHWLRLPKELNQITTSMRKVQSANVQCSMLNVQCSIKPLKDATDFIQHFAEVERLMPAELQHDDPTEWFDNAMFDTPTCKFWQWESERKEQDGSSRARYKFDLRNTPVFLRARGIVRRVMQSGDESFSRFFLLGNDHTYSELFVGQKGANKLLPQVRDIMAEWLRAHSEFNDKKGALSRAIYGAKLEQGIMESIETMDFDEKSFGEDFDYFFFHNTAVRVTKDDISLVPYSQMKWWTNQDAILDGDFTITDRLWHVEEAGYYKTELAKHEAILSAAKVDDEIKQENMRWDQWQQLWRYRLVMDKPLEEMPLHFRFLYNVCRVFWEKEQTQELTKTEQQTQDMYFITLVHALGSALVRFRPANRQQIIHITDNGTRREDLASGGTGKTIILELLSLVRRTLAIDGKSFEDSNIIIEQEFGKVIPGLHNLICLDELPKGFSPKKMYNWGLSITSRGMYRASVKLTGDDLPKIVFTSNEQIDLSSDSTSRRIYQVLASDYYHPRSMDGSRPAHTPADDFRSEGVKEVAHNLPPQILNDARNLLLQCCQLFLQYPEETFTPPRDSRALLRQALAASKDEQFTRWIAGYLADKRHLGIPIAKTELAISLLDYCGIQVGEKTIKSAHRRIRDNLGDYLRTSVFVKNPPIVLQTRTDKQNGFRRCPAWQHPMNADGTIQTDEQGNRLPRVLDKSHQREVIYFYPKARIPFNPFDPAHLGDKDYVQPAPDTDPEVEEMKNEE